MDKDNNNEIEAEKAKKSDNGKELKQAMETVFVLIILARQSKLKSYGSRKSKTALIY